MRVAFPTVVVNGRVLITQTIVINNIKLSRSNRHIPIFAISATESTINFKNSDRDTIITVKV